MTNLLVGRLHCATKKVAGHVLSNDTNDAILRSKSEAQEHCISKSCRPLALALDGSDLIISPRPSSSASKATDRDPSSQPSLYRPPPLERDSGRSPNTSTVNHKHPSHNMSGQKSAYENNRATDTDFRRTWNREEYAAKAKKEAEERKEDAQARHEAKLEGKKWHKHVDTSLLDDTSARTARLDVSSLVGKSTLVPAGAGVGKRGKGAGFYCEACDLTYKDNVQYVEHLNSKQHLINTGQSGEVKRATLEDVRNRIDLLMQRKRERAEEEQKLAETDITQRIKKTEEEDAKEREEKRRKRNEARRKKRAEAGGVKEEPDWEERLGVIT
jgi:U4/U6.U5 tri-snRNP component SNU23